MGRWARLSGESRSQSLKSEGQVTQASDPARENEQGSDCGAEQVWEASRMEGPQFYVRGPEDGPGARRASPDGCAARPPVRDAGSPRRAGAAGRWGPGRPC